MAKHVFSSEGGIPGLYRGLTITLIREIPGNALMFGFYEGAKVFFVKQQASGSGTKQQSNFSNACISGLIVYLFFNLYDISCHS